jgi:hypothetical protein
MAEPTAAQLLAASFPKQEPVPLVVTETEAEPHVLEDDHEDETDFVPDDDEQDDEDDIVRMSAARLRELADAARERELDLVALARNRVLTEIATGRFRAADLAALVKAITLTGTGQGAGRPTRRRGGRPTVGPPLAPHQEPVMARTIKSYSLTPENVAYVDANAARGKQSEFVNKVLEERRAAEREKEKAAPEVSSG